LANFFEKRNVLDTDKDADLFDKLTKKNK
jgi:hypothetical protein